MSDSASPARIPSSMLEVAAPPGSVSIIIPTFGHLDLLKACLASILEYTDLSNVEVIVVANGCNDGTARYVEDLGAPFRCLVFAEPLGFPKAVNHGISAARGEYVVLLNNDTVLMSQRRHEWIDLLLAPFKKASKVGITGPVKFWWDCGGIRRDAMAFWCVAMPRKLFTELGLLDEVFSPGGGEDGDWSIKAALAGYDLVRVPVDGSDEFGKGISNKAFPIYHVGSGTFGDKDHGDVFRRNSSILVGRYGAKDRLEEIYKICLDHSCDTNALFPKFREYASGCQHVTEFGTRGVFSTWAFLAARPARVVTYDIEYGFNAFGIAEAGSEAKKAGISFEFVHKDVLKADIEPTDLLFIDTRHTFSQLKAELERHAASVRKWILIYDTTSFGQTGEDGGPGEMPAIAAFIASHPEWSVKEVLTISNGLTVLERRSVKVSIVIPTCGKNWESVLKPCIESVVAYTDLTDKEIIVVPNGAPEGAIEYLRTKSVTIEFPVGYGSRIGYIKAVNAGIVRAKGECVVTFDDDCTLMPQVKDFWINALLEPFEKDKAVAASGPFSTVYKDEIGHVLHSGCTMYRRDVLDKLGGFDEAFNPGYMGDEDLAVRIRKAGYKLAAVPPSGPREYANGMFVLEFPVVHMGTTNTMDKHGADLPLVKKNRDLLYERHGDKITTTAIVTHDPRVTALATTLGMSPSTGQYPRVSIIIPTYKNNFLKDDKGGFQLDDKGEKINLLKQNLKTLAEYTDLVDRNIEVIVVCNGCVDGQEEYVKALGRPFRCISFPDALGYTRATNEGIKVSTGEYLIFLNDDVALLPQAKNQWFDWLLMPFLSDPKVGVTGPLQLHDDYADEDVIIGFCLCCRKSTFQEVMKETGGLLDEIYSPGAGEDIDLCCKMRRAGYKVQQVPHEGKLGFSHTNTGEFMIWHINNQTFKDVPEYTNWYVKRNGFVNMKRYNKNIRLNLGSGGIEYPGYLSVDLFDKRAAVIMDATKLDLDENSVTELLASHLFEHLNPYRVDEILKHWHRVLKPGGKLVMELPDIEKLCERFVAAKTDGYPKERYGILNAIYGSVNTTSEGEPSDITAPHLFGWWPQSLRDHLINAGFVDIAFGPEQFPHPESNMHVEARKAMPVAIPTPLVAPSMKGLWQFPQDEPAPYGDDVTYRRAAELLHDCATIEDWGCGYAYAKKFFNGAKYRGVDGSPSKFCDAVVDLVQYRPAERPEGILLRHVVDHNYDWKRILDNAVASFTKHLVLVIFTPFSSETRRIAVNWSDIPDLSFRKEDLVACWRGLLHIEEDYRTQTQYGIEHVFRVSKPQ